LSIVVSDMYGSPAWRQWTVYGQTAGPFLQMQNRANQETYTWNIRASEAWI